MSQQELLRRVVAVLASAGVDYMLTGSLVSSLQGEPRASHDIDVVVALTSVGVAALVRAFPSPDYYLDELSIAAAMKSAGPDGQFNLLEPSEGNKVDFWILSNDDFDRSRFARKYIDEIAGSKVKVSRPEDTILMKLRWADMSGGSEKQFGDALSVYELQHGQIDQQYLDRWAAHLKITALLDRLRGEARPVA